MSFHEFQMSNFWTSEDRVRRIYNNVQLRLPSAFRDGSDSEHSAHSAHSADAADAADAVSGRHSEASEDGDLKAIIGPSPSLPGDEHGITWMKYVTL